LFRLHFSECSSICIRPMALGFSGTGLVRVERVFHDGSKGSDRVAKFGDVELIQQENDGWKALADYFESARATEVLAIRRGVGLGVLLYRFLGGAGEAIVPFSSFYPNAEPEQVDSTLRRLLHETCGLWYRNANRIPTEALRLDESYRTGLNVDLERLVKSYEFRFGTPCRADMKVDYSQLDRELPHMIARIMDDNLRFTNDSWLCRTHGDMHGENVLVERESGNSWLIDFGRSGLAHWARDIAVLEAFIRLRLTSNSDLAELYAFETLLAGSRELDAPIDVLGLRDPGLQRAALAIQTLRQAAAALIEPYPLDRAMAEYVFATSKYIEFHGLLDKRWRKNHAMIAGGVMIERLDQYFAPSELVGTY
jgi:hypothetical protein